MVKDSDKTIKKESVRIWEITQNEKPNENCVRIYRTQWDSNPDKRVFAFQIRACKLMIDGDTGRSRNMVAHVEFTVGEWKKILSYIEKG